MSGGEVKAAQRCLFHFRCAHERKRMMALKSDGIRALIVDDEAPARQRIFDLLHQDPECVSARSRRWGDSSANDPQ